jgi:Papain family cysteine protease
VVVPNGGEGEAMIDNPGYGLGGVASPPDPNDWQIETLYAMAALDPTEAISEASAMASYLVPGKLPPVLNQGSLPQCVAYSQSSLKAYEDLKDQGPVTFDEGLFFRRIGGNAAGAAVRSGMSQMLKVGYPPVGAPEKAGLHKIAAYYSVPKSQASIMAAVASFGIVTVLLEWQNEWFHPVNGVLPVGRSYAGNHEIDIIGWDARGAHLRNSWGPQFGLGGDVFLSWAQLVEHEIEGWKTVDQIVAPPPSANYRLEIAANAMIMIATLKGSCISGWTSRRWGAKASSAPCRPPEVRKGCSSGQATVVYVTAGEFAGQRVRIGAGVTTKKA